MSVDHNSQIVDEGAGEGRFLVDLLLSVLHDVYDLCDVNHADLSRDVETITSRFDDEGMSFLVSTLPSFAKAMLLAFRNEEFTPILGLQKQTRRGTLPAFLRGLFNRVFTSQGKLKEDADDKCVWGIQQICFLLYKYEFPYATRLVEAKLKNMIEVEENLPMTIKQLGLSYEDELISDVARVVLEEMLADVDLYNITPGFGPGSTSWGPLPPAEKYAAVYWGGTPKGYSAYEYARTWYSDFDSVDAVFGEAGPLQDRKDLDRVSILHFVPKDARGPRLISIESSRMMYIQQGQRRVIEDAAVKYSKGHVNFRDQTVNADLALSASLKGDFATLDMKDASDRVSLALAGYLLPAHVLKPLLATRSTHTMTKPDAPAPAFIKLRKFAPMGSAVCFPVESIIFWALSVACVQVLHPTNELEDSMRLVYVFGDDLIVPSCDAEYIMHHMEQFSLLFNQSKCYLRGPFRESCGCDAFKGFDVTPIKVKSRLPTGFQDHNAIKAWSDYANDFARNWMWRASNQISAYLQSIVGEELPMCSEPIGCLYLHTFSTRRPVGERYIWKTNCKNKSELRHPCIFGRRLRGLVSTPVKFSNDTVDDRVYLLQWFVERSTNPSGRFILSKRTGEVVFNDTSGVSRSYTKGNRFTRKWVYLT